MRCNARSVAAQHDRQGRGVSEAGQRAQEPVLAKDDGVDAMGQLAELVDALVELLDGRVELLDGHVDGGPAPSLSVGPSERRLRQSKLERDGQQPLLGAVVEIAFQPTRAWSTGLHDAGSRCLQLPQPCPDRRLESLVVHGQPRRGADLAVEQVGVEVGVVLDECHGLWTSPIA